MPQNSTTPRRKHQIEIGQKIGRWTILGSSDRVNSVGQKVFLECRCDCGTVRTVGRSGLTSGASQSCGCLHVERVSGKKKERFKVRCQNCYREFETYPSCDRKFCSKECALPTWGDGTRRHGMSKTRIHVMWCDMKARCVPGSRTAKYYGDRGISVCGEWANSFEVFRDWAMANGYSDHLEIDRKDNDKGYSPDNCRFATRVEQMRNMRKRCDAKTSRFKGVSWSTQSGKWRVQLHANGKPIYVGEYRDEREAALAYDKAAKEKYGQFASLNFKEV